MKNSPKPLLMLLLILVGSNVYCQNDKLSIFNPFVNVQWIGNYVNSSDSTLSHYIKWEYSLDSTYIKQTKEVPKLNFKMETYFYWDYELKQLSSLALLNRNMISKGRIELVDDKLELISKTFKSEESSNSKQSFEITVSGSVKDYFYQDKSGEWVQGHLIIYERMSTLPAKN